MHELRVAGELELLVVDLLASFLPGHSDSDPGTLLDLLQPLQRLAQTGVAVAILHHPRKKRSEEGSAARGSGALLGFVDVIVELNRFSTLKSDENRRRIFSLSRHRDTPRLLAYELDPVTNQFVLLDDPEHASFEDNWSRLRSVLLHWSAGGTVPEILQEWPSDRDKPSRGFAALALSRAG